MLLVRLFLFGSVVVALRHIKLFTAKKYLRNVFGQVNCHKRIYDFSNRRAKKQYNINDYIC